MAPVALVPLKLSTVLQFWTYVRMPNQQRLLPKERVASQVLRHLPKVRVVNQDLHHHPKVNQASLDLHHPPRVSLESQDLHHLRAVRVASQMVIVVSTICYTVACRWSLFYVWLYCILPTYNSNHMYPLSPYLCFLTTIEP